MSGESDRMDRRAALKWMLTAAAAIAVPRVPGAPGAKTPAAKGYGFDPDLSKDYAPGDLWPLTFADGQRRTAAALCDLIIPADEHSPGAASLHVHDFIDEWISAPYPDCAKDRPVILEGLAWLEAESARRFGSGFAQLDVPRQREICDDLRYEPEAKPAFRQPARFFARFRDLTAGGFYTTEEGTRDLGYVGNAPSGTFDGPPPDLIRKLGLD